jgi:hypothetical protein
MTWNWVSRLLVLRQGLVEELGAFQMSERMAVR